MCKYCDMVRVAVLAHLFSLLVGTASARERSMGFGDYGLAPTQIETRLGFAPKNEIFDQTLILNQRLLERDNNTWRAILRTGSFQSDSTSYPSSLKDFELGASFVRKFQGERDLGLRLSVGSASDKPFKTASETVVNLLAHYRYPANPSDSWILVLAYSNNRTFANNIPLPGFAYLARSEDRRFTALFGLPFLMASWLPDRDWSVKGSYLFPLAITGQVARTIWGPVQGFVAFDWDQASWLRAAREVKNERLYYDTKSAGAGVKFPFSRELVVSATGGYAFDRRFFEAESILKEKRGVNELAASPFVLINLVYRIF